ncbi:sensor histidine kinase [Nocardiopsis baichengensis]|uniref:sensor histidine kinase n=1 Tax=Nocardiopsis baichengensis TaxID=280240 RepID=UPI00034C3594|nr:HAMP domain-containing sensor histidine kinase [Nocardiopsis baichengensis]
MRGPGHLPRPRTLTARITAGVLLLTTAALVAFGLAAVLLLQRSLVGDIDTRLQGMASGPSPPGPGQDQDGHRPPPLPTEFRQLSLDGDGRVRWSVGQTEGDEGGPDTSGLDAEALSAREGRPFTLPDTGDGGSWRVLAVPDGGRDGSAGAEGDEGTGGYRLVAHSLSGVDRTLTRLGLIEAGLAAALLVLLAGGTAWVVRGRLRPLRRIERTAQAIAAGDLDARVPEEDPASEAGRLGTALNTMLGELSASLRERERAADRMRRFVADASHELRTPLSSIRGFAELYEQSRDQGAVRGDPSVDRWMGRVRGESDRMAGLVEDLLVLARFDGTEGVGGGDDGGGTPLDPAELDLRDVAEEAVLDARARAPGTPVAVEAPEAVPVVADGRRMRQVVGNLLANALAHPPEGTPVRVSVRRSDAPPLPGTPGASARDAGAGAAGPPDTDHATGAPGPFAVVEVHDDGPGIPDEDAAHVFDRFYRVEESRSRDRGGAGLGLSITAALVAAHGGYVRLDTAPGQGTTFTVVLPAGGPPGQATDGLR